MAEMAEFPTTLFSSSRLKKRPQIAAMMRTRPRNPARLGVRPIHALLNIPIAIPKGRNAVEVGAEVPRRAGDGIAATEVVAPGIVVHGSIGAGRGWRIRCCWLWKGGIGGRRLGGIGSSG